MLGELGELSRLISFGSELVKSLLFGETFECGFVLVGLKVADFGFDFGGLDFFLEKCLLEGAGTCELVSTIWE